MRSGNFDIYGVHSFLATFGGVRDHVAFPNVVDQARYVYENFLFGGVVNDESKAFGVVEKFNCSSIHKKNRKKSKSGDLPLQR